MLSELHTYTQLHTLNFEGGLNQIIYWDSNILQNGLSAYQSTIYTMIKMQDVQ